MDSTVSVFDIERYAIEDGPGIRTVVFFKGCNLKCTWCQNPESWQREGELAHKGHLCVGCRSCVEACPTGAMLEPGTWDTSRCDLCLKCVDACPAAALVHFGERYSTEEGAG